MKTVSWKKPLIIEFLGMPKTGKTRTSGKLHKILSEKSINIYSIKERASICPITDKLHPSFDFWTASAFIREYTTLIDSDIDIVIADRGLLDAVIWVRMFSKMYNNPTLRFDIEKLVLDSFVTKNIVSAFFFHADIQTVLDRGREENKVERRNRIMNSDILSRYLDAFNEVEHILSSVCPLIKIDSNKNEIFEANFFFIKTYIEKLVITGRDCL